MATMPSPAMDVRLDLLSQAGCSKIGVVGDHHIFDVVAMIIVVWIFIFYYYPNMGATRLQLDSNAYMAEKYSF